VNGFSRQGVNAVSVEKKREFSVIRRRSFGKGLLKAVKFRGKQQEKGKKGGRHRLIPLGETASVAKPNLGKGERGSAPTLRYVFKKRDLYL